LIDTLETKENLTIDSEDLLNSLDNFNHDRISIENSLNEHRIQREVLYSRTGAEVYRETARDLIQFYIVLRDSDVQLKIPIKWFVQIVTKNLSRKIETNIESSNSVHKVRARKTYLRCFESIYSYLSLSLADHHLQSILVLLALIKHNRMEFFQSILRKLNPIDREIIPQFLDDPKRPSFINSHSWILCFEEKIKGKYLDLSQHLMEDQIQWKEYLFSSTKLDFINKFPLEKTTTMTIIDRFILCLILRPDRVSIKLLFLLKSTISFL
jgi:hypothetical protein